MKTVNKTLVLNTRKELDFTDITEAVKVSIAESQVKNGLVNIQTLHTTCPLLVNENEPLLIDDFKNHLAQLSPKNLSYNHNNLAIRTVNMCDGECQNGHSHCLAMHLPSNVTLNIINGGLQLGQWQKIFTVELDKPRERKIQIQIIGE